MFIAVKIVGSLYVPTRIHVRLTLMNMALLKERRSLPHPDAINIALLRSAAVDLCNLRNLWFYRMFTARPASKASTVREIMA
jgi:hypothetical protein